MLRLLHTREGTEYSRASVQGRDSGRSVKGFLKTAENKRIAALGDRFASLRKEAAIHFVALDDSDSDCSGERVRQITPIGKIRDPDRSMDGFENELEWSLVKPKDNNYPGILLSSEKPSIESVACQFKDCDFIIDDFDLGSQHAWKRMF